MKAKVKEEFEANIAKVGILPTTPAKGCYRSYASDRVNLDYPSGGRRPAIRVTIDGKLSATLDNEIQVTHWLRLAL